MIEKKYEFGKTDEKLIERIVDDENAAINHIVLAKGDAIPEHYSSSNVYLIIIRGNLTLRLEDQKESIYSKGSIINIPYNTKMNGVNKDTEAVEFFVIKSPGSL